MAAVEAVCKFRTYVEVARNVSLKSCALPNTVKRHCHIGEMIDPLLGS